MTFRADYELPSGHIVTLILEDYYILPGYPATRLEPEEPTEIEDLSWIVDLERTDPRFLQSYSCEQVEEMANLDDDFYDSIYDKILEYDYEAKTAYAADMAYEQYRDRQMFGD